LQALLNGSVVDSRHRAIAEQLSAAAKRSIVLGSEAQMHPSYAQLQALAALIAESLNAPLGSLTSGANSAGACLAGCLPHRGVAGKAVDQPGLDAGAMIQQPLQAYVLLNVEAESDCADAHQTSNALMEARFVVSLSPFRSKAMEKYADVILPVTPFTETSGTFVNVEGQWQSFAAAVAPLGEARPAWKVLRVLGNLFDVDGFDYVSSDEIRAELELACAGVTPETRAAAPLTGPVPAIDGLERIADVPIYAVDSITRRASSLQMTADAAPLAALINSEEVKRRSLMNVEEVNVQQQGEPQRLPLVIDERIPDGCVMIAAGVPGSSELGCYGSAVHIAACTG